MLSMMEDWLNKASYMQLAKGTHLSHKKISQQMKVCVILIRRIKEDEHDYSAPNQIFRNRNCVAGSLCEVFGVDKFEYNPKSDELRKRDLDYLFDYMKKYMMGWWD